MLATFTTQARSRLRSIGVRALPAFVKAPLRKFVSNERIIAQQLKGKRGLFFVQIGSNDGKRGDPLHDYIVKNKDWRGIFVEPVRFVFERLRANYGNEARFRFLNIAISDRAAKKPFYYVAENAKTGLPDLPLYYDQFGSFNRDHITNHFGSAIEPYVITQEIECMTLANVLENISRIDVLHIDTEGHDYHILSQMPFNVLAPGLIIYEHGNLPPNERAAALDLLRKHGYRLIQDNSDTIAVKSASLRFRLGEMIRSLSA